MSERVKPARIFISCSPRDQAFLLELEAHLAVLRRQDLIRTWTARLLGAGDRTAATTRLAIASADIVLLLISSDFLDNEECVDLHLAEALAHQAAGTAEVIPIILRACDWTFAPFARLQPLPTDGRPITTWSDRDEAWVDVVHGLRAVLDRLSKTAAVGIDADPALAQIRVALLTASNSTELEAIEQQVAQALRTRFDDPELLALHRRVIRSLEAERRYGSSPKLSAWRSTLPLPKSRRPILSLLAAGLLVSFPYGWFVLTPCANFSWLTLFRGMFLIGTCILLYRLATVYFEKTATRIFVVCFLATLWLAFGRGYPLTRTSEYSSLCSYKGVLLTSSRDPIPQAGVTLVGTTCAESTSNSGLFDFKNCDHTELARIWTVSMAVTSTDGISCDGIQLYDPPAVTIVELDLVRCKVLTRVAVKPSELGGWGVGAPPKIPDGGTPDASDDPPDDAGAPDASTDAHSNDAELPSIADASIEDARTDGRDHDASELDAGFADAGEDVPMLPLPRAYQTPTTPFQFRSHPQMARIMSLHDELHEVIKRAGQEGKCLADAHQAMLAVETDAVTLISTAYNAVRPIDEAALLTMTNRASEALSAARQCSP